MFSSEYIDRAVVISAYNIRRLDFRHKKELQKHIHTASRLSCNKIILNLAGVRQVDIPVVEMLSQLNRPASEEDIRLCLVNLDLDVLEQIVRVCSDLSSCIFEPAQLEEYLEFVMC
jgi:anti-anti-sigma regulatory factor